LGAYLKHKALGSIPSVGKRKYLNSNHVNSPYEHAVKDSIKITNFGIQSRETW
jgi:hypothetical protein